MLFEVAIFSFGILLNLIGFIGCFVPILPGPTFNLLSIFLLQLSHIATKFSLLQLLFFTFSTFLVLILDNFLPVMTAKAYGSSFGGLVGSSLGLIIGFFFFPPFGIIIGAFVGAFIGELISKKKNKEAIKAGLATTLGFIFGIGAKLSIASIVLFYFIKKSNIWILFTT